MLQLLALLLFAYPQIKRTREPIEPPPEYTKVEIADIKPMGPKKIEIFGIIDSVSGEEEKGLFIKVCKDEKCLTSLLLPTDRFSNRAPAFQKGFRAVLSLHKDGETWYVDGYATMGGKR